MRQLSRAERHAPQAESILQNQPTIHGFESRLDRKGDRHPAIVAAQQHSENDASTSILPYDDRSAVPGIGKLRGALRLDQECIVYPHRVPELIDYRGR